MASTSRTQSAQSRARAHQPTKDREPKFATPKIDGHFAFAETPETNVGSVQRATERVHGAIASINSSWSFANTTADRLLGARPQEAGTVTDTECEAMGDLGRLHMALGFLERAVVALDDEIRRLSPA